MYLNMPQERIVAPDRHQGRYAAAITRNPYDFRYWPGTPCHRSQTRPARSMDLRSKTIVPGQ